MPLTRNAGSYIQLQDVSDVDSKPCARPQAYSDSFLVVPAVAAAATQQPHVSPPFAVKYSFFRPRFDCEWWTEKAISILIHISLISIFETLFFFAYVSASEDTALLRAVDQFIGGFEGQCGDWPAADTALVRAIMADLINTTALQAAAGAATAERTHYNTDLQRQAWAYFIGIAGTTAVLIGLAIRRRYAVHWRRIWAENVALVAVLGIYEFAFFRTIVYNYTSLSSAELKWAVVENVNASCAIF